MLVRIVENELYKIFARKKIYIFVGVLFLMVLLTGLSTSVTNNIGGDSSLAVVFTGQAFPATLLGSLITFVLPIMVVMLVADSLTGEYAEGSLKLTLTRKVSRNKLFLAKVLSISIVLMVLLLFVMVSGYIIGTIIFGFGNNFAIKGAALSIGGGIFFTIFIYALSVVPLMVFGLIIFFFAIIFSNEGTVISIGIGLLLLLSLLGQVFFDLTPFLVNTYFSLYSVYTSGSDILSMTFGILVMLLEGIIFYIVDSLILNKKDLLI